MRCVTVRCGTCGYQTVSAIAFALCDNPGCAPSGCQQVGKFIDKYLIFLRSLSNAIPVAIYLCWWVSHAANLSQKMGKGIKSPGQKENHHHPPKKKKNPPDFKAEFYKHAFAIAIATLSRSSRSHSTPSPRPAILSAPSHPLVPSAPPPPPPPPWRTHYYPPRRAAWPCAAACEPAPTDAMIEYHQVSKLAHVKLAHVRPHPPPPPPPPPPPLPSHQQPQTTTPFISIKLCQHSSRPG